ncbi:MAG: glycosyltransferase family 2 protein [Saprospiraceae bacterium]|nr:glycosyltransferase family 2 protein [Saprospiraceae bacterium]
MNDDIEIIVIDNNSNDNTSQIVCQYTIKYENLRYVIEPQLGLSYARNRGIKEAKTDWILYLDDDAIAFPDLLKRAFYLVNRGDFDCVGGMYYGYFEGERPKWIPADFGTKLKYSNDLQICPFNIPHGGIVLYNKLILTKVGGFDAHLGMIGKKIRYGEEVILQKKIYEIKGKIAFDPDLKIYHLVNKDNRLILKNMLLYKYELGRSHKLEENPSLTERLYRFGRSTLGIPKRLLLNLVKLLISRDYFWQNLLFDSFSPFIYYLGKLR